MVFSLVGTMERDRSSPPKRDAAKGRGRRRARTDFADLISLRVLLLAGGTISARRGGA